MSLTPDQFPLFFRALWGYDPFPWQARLAQRVCAGGWPAGCLDLPTGSGKTAALEIAVFALALSATTGRPTPRRVVLVVDRRVIVDQAHERAVSIASALGTGAVGILGVVREALLSLQGEGETSALEAAVLRGGMLRDNAWARVPSQPLILSSTVDQVGSRLLFRGYGVSSSMRPVHAGLLGADALFLLDEVHLSEPFAETLESLVRFSRSPLFKKAPQQPWEAVRMSATPGAEGLPTAEEAFGLNDTDRTHPVLGARLRASKPAGLLKVTVKGDESDRRSHVASRVAAAVADLLSDGRQRVGVVVNRVDVARRIHTHLAESSTHDCVLLTGRMRPLDRDDVFNADVRRRLVASERAKSEHESRKPIVVVATQTIEAGADLDFDALVTECASLDALRQRFGRLNRLGSSEPSTALVFVRSDQIRSSSDPDPIYGSALRATWIWLNEVASEDTTCVDFGIEALDALLTDVRLEPLVSNKEHAPVLQPAHLDHLVQTGATPTWEGRDQLDLQPWLHGPQCVTSDVSVVWRADMTRAELEVARSGTTELGDLIARVSACPPAAVEAISLPAWALSQWLSEARLQGDVSDVEGANEDQEPSSSFPPLLSWRGEHSTIVSRGNDVVPGETFLLPAEYGGIGALSRNWDPGDRTPVSDLGDRAQCVQRGIASVRFHPEVLRACWSAGDPSWQAALQGDQPGPGELRRKVKEWAATRSVGGGLADWQTACLEAVQRARGTRLQLQVCEGAAGETAGVPWLAARCRIDRSALIALQPGGTRKPSPVSTEEDVSSFLGHEVALASHLNGVGKRAGVFARSCRLPSELVEDLELAGFLHDLGKADPRFQLMLHGADEVAAAMASEPLAKSAIHSADRRAREQARQRSCYPRGARHELMSVALVQDDEALSSRAHDWDLVLHLVASHHGHCRPFSPPVLDKEPVEVEVTHDAQTFRASSAHGLAALDSGISERFWRLVGAYGWHGLAYLEAILRLADHRQSESEESHRVERVGASTHDAR